MSEDRPAPSRKPPLQSLATRVILVVFLATFLTAGVVTWLAVRSTYSFLRDDLDDRLPAEASALAGQLSPALASTEKALQALAADPALTASPETGADLLETTLRAQGDPGAADLDALALVARDGRVLAAAGAPHRTRALALLPWQTDSPLAALRMPDGGDDLAAWTVSLPGETGPLLRGALAVPTSLLAARSDPDPGLRARIVDPAGRARWVLLGESDPGPDRVVPPSAAVGVYRGAEGQFLVGAAVPLDVADLRLVVERPFRSAFSPVFSMLTRVFLADLCIVLFFSFLAYRLTAAIVRPIEDLSDGARRISVGELDVEVPEPPGHDEVALLTRTFNDMTRKLRRQRSEIHTAAVALRERNEDLQRANEVLEQLSITDGLTKLHNHRYFQDSLTREIKRVTRNREPLSVLLIDIDDFKRLNDRLGHASGDELLIGLARILNDATRESDLAARYGGEEFVVLAADTDLEGAVALAEKIRMSVQEASFILDDSMQLTKMTVSIGVAQYAGNRKTFFTAADQALYRAKAEGKNCVLSAEPEPGTGTVDAGTGTRDPEPADGPETEAT